MERPLKIRRLHGISVNQLMDEYYIFSTNYMNILGKMLKKSIK